LPDSKNEHLLTVHDGLSAGEPAGAAPQYPIDAQFNTALADELARLETYNKHHYRPNTYLHKWWARRCGSTFRLILKHLVTEPDQQGYYAAGGLTGRIVLDPMVGGGTTLHEAIRLGANVIGADIDPVPIVQARATLRAVPLADLEDAFQDFVSRLHSALGDLYNTSCPHCAVELPLRYVLYGLRRSCACGPVTLVDSRELRYKQGEPVIWLCAYCGEVCAAGIPCPCVGAGGRERVQLKDVRRCSTCGESYREEQQPFYTRYEPLVVVGRCPQHGLFYKAPAAADLLRIAKSDEERNLLNLDIDNSFRVVNGPKANDLISRSIKNYQELFTGRQLRFLAEAENLLSRFPAPIRLNLALLVSTALEFNSLLCGYKGPRRGERSGAIRHAFSYHAYTFPYTAVENNMLYPDKASGTLQKLFHDRIRRARKWAAAPRERNLSAGKKFIPISGERDSGTEVETAGELRQGERRFFLYRGSATDLPIEDGLVDFVVTDPPYFDSVQYNDLASFFRVWLRKLLPAGEEWDYDPAGSAVDPHANGAGQYTQVLSGIFAECRRVLRAEQGRLVFTFHHWNPLGWAALTIALQRAGFRLVNRYVVQSENPVSVHIANVSSLKHDAILVLAPAGAVETRKWDRPEAIDKTDSYAFNHTCATMLGWMLAAAHAEETIHSHWRKLLV